MHNATILGICERKRVVTGWSHQEINSATFNWEVADQHYRELEGCVGPRILSEPTLGVSKMRVLNDKLFRKWNIPTFSQGTSCMRDEV